ncbi:MAG: UDP-glucose/GDP-mannose dehydrogenase family protein [Saprospiraceae bacterium]|nr:UDP-glucose/GDP-mannose dehydrogenase family protein [Saprospiraceae bacterium]
MKIAVIGTGYVGLVTGTCLSETGHHVVCVDNNLDKINNLNAGIIPIYEPGLELLIDRNTNSHRLTFTTDLKEAVENSEIVFLALPTPPGEDGSADLSYVLSVATDLTNYIQKYTIIVNKSTVPVGTAEKIKSILSNSLSPDLYDVVSNPEFLREGVAVDDFLRPDRVVVGSDSEKATQWMKQLYDPFVRQGNPIFFMDLRSAELTKYAANAYLAMRISFMNEMANLCEHTGANVDMVRLGIGSDNRIGKRFLFPGIGYGGSCFPKDVNALYYTSQQHNYHFKILESVMEVNKLQKNYFINKLLDRLGNSLNGIKLAIWGLSFKPNTDDIRAAPALDMIEVFLNAGASISVYDPEAMNNVKQLFGDRLNYAIEMYDALDDANALLILTEWSEFRSPDFDIILSKLKDKIIGDGRNVYDPKMMKELGFDYFSVGRT